MKKLLIILWLCTIPCFAQYEIPIIPGEIPQVVVEHTGYTVSFNTKHNNPNWVGWHLTKKRLIGPATRTDKFTKDRELPAKHRVGTSDYSYTGYDRGHMCPAADNRWSIGAMAESFYMSNVCPQVPELNRRWWEHLEEACRRWVREDGADLYIICGPIYFSKSPQVIGRNIYIDVPNAFFKVILDTTLKRSIGYLYKNSDKRQPMDDCRTTVDSIEELTGYDFFWQIDTDENSTEWRH